MIAPQKRVEPGPLKYRSRLRIERELAVDHRQNVVRAGRGNRVGRSQIRLRNARKLGRQRTDRKDLAAFQRFDYDFVCAIILSIIAMIIAGEVLTNAVKRVFRA